MKKTLLLIGLMFLVACGDASEDNTSEVDDTVGEENNEEETIVDNENDIQTENEDEESSNDNGDSEISQEEAYNVFFESITTMYRSYLNEIGGLLTDESSYYTEEWESDLQFFLSNMKSDSEEVLEKNDVPDSYKEAHEHLVTASENANEVANNLFKAIEEEDYEKIEELEQNVEDIGNYAAEAIKIYEEIKNNNSP